MIASLLLASFAAQSPPSHPLEDYLPGGPDRVHADAVEWLQRSKEWLDAQDGAEVRLEVTRDDQTSQETHWFFRGRIAIRANDLDRGFGFESPDLPVAYAASVLRQTVWEDAVYGGLIPLATWLRGHAVPELAALSLQESLPSNQGVRLHWIRDGLRGTIDIGPSGAPLAWTWIGDGHWKRTATTRVRVLSWETRTSAQAPEQILPALGAAELDFDIASVHGRPREPLASLSAPEATHLLLQSFGESRGIRWSGEMNILVGQAEETAIEVGEIDLDAHLGWPAMGSLSMKGAIGPPDQQRQVHTEIVGDRRRYWHWDRLDDALRPIPGLVDLLAGMQGFLPLYAWAARGVPDLGWEANWMGEAFEQGDSTRRWLSIVDGPTTTELLLQHWTVLEARVFATGAGPGAPVVHYRFDSLSPQDRIGLIEYEESSERIAERVEQERARELEADPRIAELLAVGERAPSAAKWQSAEGESQSLESLRGKPTVLIFWYRDPTGSLPALKAIHDLRRKMDRVGERMHVRAIAINEPAEASASWLSEQQLALPLGIGDSSLQRAFRARWLPTTYLLGADGVVLGRWLGTPGPELGAQLERLLRRGEASRD